MARTARSSLLRLAGWTVAAIVVAYVSRNLWSGIAELRRSPLATPPRWSRVMASGVVFLLAHAVLVQTWRSMLATWDQRMSFLTAARIWSVSNLGKYVPGKIWQVGAMSAMSKEAGISPVIAPTAAILGTLLSVITGFAVALGSGRVLLEAARPGWASLAASLLFLSVIGLLCAPFVVPRLAIIASRMSGRTIETTLPMRAVVYGLAGNVSAWLLYGAAFRLLASGLLRQETGDYASYLAAYTISYLVGYLVLFAPAGVGFREEVMLHVLPLAGLATVPQASLITLVSRVWITILEVTPALFFWVVYRMRHRSHAHSARNAET